jgi:hypothetical protein
MSRYPDDDEREPPFPFLDEWLKKIPFVVHLAMALIGGFVGYYLFSYYGWLIPRQGAFAGAVVGFLWPYFLVSAFRVAAMAVFIGLCLWLFYWLFLAPLRP